MKLKCFHFFLYSFLLLSSKVSGQQFNYVHYTKEHGLAGNMAYSIAQDRSGFIWIGTENGVSRFDGAEFTNFTTEDGLTDNEVLEVFCDSKGRVWFICFTAPLCFYENGKIHNPTNSPDIFNGVESNGVLDFCEDAKGNIWFRSRHVLFFSNNRFHQIKFNLHYTKSLKPHPESIVVTPYGINKNGNYFTSDGSRIVELVDTTKLIWLDSLFMITIPGLSNINVKSVVNASDNCFHSYTNNGIVTTKFNDRSKLEVLHAEVTPYNINRIIYDKVSSKCWVLSHGEGTFTISTDHRRTSERFLPDKNLSMFVVDRNFNYWFSTLGDGIYFLNASGIKTIELEKNEFKNEIFSFCFSKNNELLVGYEYGNVEEYINHKRVAAYRVSDMKLKSNVVKKMLQTSDGDLCFATENQIVQMTGKHQVKYVKLIQAIKDAEILGGNKIGVINRSTCILIDNGHVDTIAHGSRYTSVGGISDTLFWFSSIDTLFKCVNGYVIPELIYDVEREGRIIDLCYPADEILWISTYNQGLKAVFRNKIYRFGIKEGLLSNQCRTLYSEAPGKLWVVTDRGITKLTYDVKDPSKNYAMSLSRNDGLPSDMIRQVLKQNDTVYVATDKGIAFFRESQLKSTTEIPVFIEEWKVNDSRPLSSQLSYHQNRVAFRFTSVSFNSGKDVKYKYFLSGLDNGWSITGRRTIDYASLQPGKYTFYVVAIDKNGNESQQPAKVSFTIEAPFWEKLWFRMAAFNVAGLSLFLFMRIRIKKIATKAQEKQEVSRQLAELKLEAVRAQMNPHFIFNCLNAIQHYNVSHNFDSAQQFLSDFAMLIRKTLHLSKQDFISLREELSFLESYIKLEKLRFEDQFTYSFLIDPNIDLDQMKVPSLLLQPFVENSINHGLKYRKEPGGTIDISFTKSRDELIVKVSDNGIGIVRSMELKAARGVSHQSQGTNLTTNRIEVINKIYKTAMRLQISSSEAGAAHSGTIVTLIIPLTPSTL